MFGGNPSLLTLAILPFIRYKIVRVAVLISIPLSIAWMRWLGDQVWTLALLFLPGFWSKTYKKISAQASLEKGIKSSYAVFSSCYQLIPLSPPGNHTNKILRIFKRNVYPSKQEPQRYGHEPPLLSPSRDFNNSDVNKPCPAQETILATCLGKVVEVIKALSLIPKETWYTLKMEGVED